MAIGLAALVGCGGGPTVEPDHQRLLASLRTAISARNADWLQQNVDLIAAEHEQQKMSDEVRAAFDEVVALAREQEWAEAEERLVAWQMSQSPTEQQQARVANRELAGHTHADEAAHDETASHAHVRP